MYRIWKSFRFEAAHWLPVVPEGHKCGQTHGHSFKVIVELAGPLNEYGFVLDFGELSEVGQWIADSFDDGVVNDTVYNPTCELLAQHIVDNAPWPPEVRETLLQSVWIQETDSCGGGWFRD